MKNISERNISLVIETTRHDRSIAKYAYLIAKSVAENVFRPFVSGKIGPVEFIAVLDIRFICNTDTRPLLDPWFREKLLRPCKNISVFFVLTAAVPESV